MPRLRTAAADAAVIRPTGESLPGRPSAALRVVAITGTAITLTGLDSLRTRLTIEYTTVRSNADAGSGPVRTQQ
jgi:hypothetical protein